MSTKKTRPRQWADFIGQKETVERLKVMVEGARKEGRALDHILLTGPPGLGKTTLAGILAAQLGTKLYAATAPALPTPEHLANFLVVGKARDVFFLDEIHRITKPVQETLYPAMEDYYLDATIDLSGEKWTGRIALEPFTLIGATTTAGLLAQPMRDRFGTVERLEPYTPEELADIVRRSATILGSTLGEEAIKEIATRSRGTPRVANRLLARVRDYSLAHSPNSGSIDLATTRKALDLFGADVMGLDYVGRALLLALARAGRPLGLEALAALVNEDTVTVEALEAHLMRIGLIERSPRGRAITPEGRRYAATLEGR